MHWQQQREVFNGQIHLLLQRSFEMYKLIKTLSDNTNFVLRLSDNAFIPFDDANSDFAEYKKWLDKGNEPLPADEVK
jgi:hypothetical protein